MQEIFKMPIKIVLFLPFQTKPFISSSCLILVARTILVMSGRRRLCLVPDSRGILGRKHAIKCDIDTRFLYICLYWVKFPSSLICLEFLSRVYAEFCNPFFSIEVTIQFFYLSLIR